MTNYTQRFLTADLTPMMDFPGVGCNGSAVGTTCYDTPRLSGTVVMTYLRLM